MVKKATCVTLLFVLVLVCMFHGKVMGLPCKRIDEGCTQERCNAACGGTGKCGINFKWLCCCNEHISLIKDNAHILPNKH
ncbi:unnamed protein product [Amaranthus hypochondriacus]